jgi:hypothetical protein
MADLVINVPGTLVLLAIAFVMVTIASRPKQ